MAKFCAECGVQLDPQAKFCSGCGTSRPSDGAPAPTPAQAPAPTPAPPPVAPPPDPTPQQASIPPRYEHPPAKNTGLIIGITVAVVGVLIAGALAAYMFLKPNENDAAISPIAAAPTATAEDPNAARPQSWFDDYSDKFQSADLTRLVSGTAQQRNFPTARGSKVLETMKQGVAVTGRWVEGADPKTRWLKTTDGGYIWEGNLSKLETITASGMLGLTANSPFSELRGKIDPNGQYGSGDPSWDTQACETYASNDGLVDVMVEQGKVTSLTTTNTKLATAKSIKVGSSEADLRKAYGSELKPQPNPYDGTDYYVWDSKNLGVKFHVSSAGKIEFISSGTKSIEYVEGCL